MNALPAPGDRVRMVGLMPNDPDPIPVGTEGTVTEVNPYVFQGAQQIYVTWDTLVDPLLQNAEGTRKRTLILLSTDPYEILA